MPRKSASEELKKTKNASSKNKKISKSSLESSKSE
jgi:hypothetical protein